VRCLRMASNPSSQQSGIPVRCNLQMTQVATFGLAMYLRSLERQQVMKYPAARDCPLLKPSCVGSPPVGQVKMPKF
jgi:hypothetical protein